MKLGPNVRKLIAHKMALLMIPPGSTDAFATGVRALSSRDEIASACREATTWVGAALSVVRTAPDNTFADDEAIAGELLRRIEQRRAAL